MAYWSERKAWLYLAERFKKARKEDDEFGYFLATMQGRSGVYGLCAGIRAMFFINAVSPKTNASMMSKIPLKRRFLTTFVWSPRTSRGRAQRVAFCLKQAKLLRKVSG